MTKSAGEVNLWHSWYHFHFGQCREFFENKVMCFPPSV